MKKIVLQRRCLNVREVACILGISLGNAYALVASQGFPSIRIGRRIIVPEDSFERWLNRQQVDTLDVGSRRDVAGR